MDALGPPLVLGGGPGFIGPDLTLVPTALVVIEGGTIRAAGPRSQVEVPAGAEVIDTSGSVIAPGFIDSHVHIGLSDPAAVLHGGVTTARDLAWPVDVIFELARRSEDPSFPGPRILAAGPMLTAPGGYPMKAGWAPPGTGIEVSDEAEAVNAVARLAEAGAAIIKVALNPPAGPVLDFDTLGAIVGAAGSHGLDVTAHVAGLDELEKALDAGVHELAHMLMSTERIPSSLIERMVEEGMRVVSTLSIREGHDLRLAIENTQRFVQAGGTLLYGTDLGNDGPEPGIDRKEIQALTEAGLSGPEIVRSATVGAAGPLGLDDRGAIEPGLVADLVLLDERAVSDATALTKIRGVVKAGRLLGGSHL